MIFQTTLMVNPQNLESRYLKPTYPKAIILTSLFGNLMVQAYLWCTDLMEQKCMFEEHSHAITDTRFSPTMPWLATSSLDKTVRVWDVENVSQHVFSFV